MIKILYMWLMLKSFSLTFGALNSSMDHIMNLYKINCQTFKTDYSELLKMTHTLWELSSFKSSIYMSNNISMIVSRIDLSRGIVYEVMKVYYLRWKWFVLLQTNNGMTTQKDLEIVSFVCCHSKTNLRQITKCFKFMCN